MDPKDAQKKVEKITVEASAAKVRKLLGEAGGPIAEGMMTLKGEVDARVNEMRGYADGAGKSAQEAKALAAKAAEALDQAEARNDSLLGQLDRKTTDMKQQVFLASTAAEKAEEAVLAVQKETGEVTLAIKELHAFDLENKPVSGVAALQVISQKAEAITETVQSAVDSAITITVLTTKRDDDTGEVESVPETLSGREAFQHVSERVDYAARAAGDAISKADTAISEAAELKAGLDALGEAVADAFDTVDKKLKIMMKMLERAGVDVPQAAKDVMNDSSYTVGGTDE